MSDEKPTYYELNKERLKEKARENYAKKRKKRMRQMKTYYHRDPKGHYEKYKENKKKWYKENTEHRKQYMKEYRAKRKAEKDEMGTRPSGNGLQETPLLSDRK